MLTQGLSRLNVTFVAGTLDAGGAERQLYYILEALQQSGANTRLLCLDKGGFWADRIKALGVPITWIGDQGAPAKRLIRIAAAIRPGRPHVVQSQHFYVNPYVGLAARAIGALGIGALRNEGKFEFESKTSWMTRACLRATRLLASNSRAGMRTAIDRGLSPERVKWLPNVVDTDQFAPAAARSDRPVTLVCAGRLIPVKRVDRFLAALSRLRSAGSWVRGIVVGDGPLRGSLEEQSHALGLRDAVEFWGEVSNVADAFRAADICVLASESEGTPNVLLEAMSCGLPIVATRVGDVPHIVKEGETGVLINIDDDLVEALSPLVDDRSLREEMGQNARAHMVGNYSRAKLPDYLSDLYSSVVR